MAITRGTERFALLAEQTQAAARRRGIAVTDEVIDQILNAEIERVAKLMGIEPRTALLYTPADLPLTLAEMIAATHHQ
ncbi:putative protein OS=Tsukamurella paurometabola (strain ATCC 8368 / DSM / CCUG 35730 /CIP 100753 / JCM 10117 / KCTC 9821 / NBRC 16120 / NCIMB 702349/ NCTC 13040) OX=521096 GN=Tpau_0223 PE=4 SV=1 [Tsukamurella paurometabola]|uniref:Uncharacterized protein n=1 Tax=Tsukamurella paurometabola (strain ATCC 8368 / DSM 20162 / CCUG 35730 / CIP 100753 / JCM 10117 / KCTC 9821 / NBRC 16120 / NCIMB 702349 / NCTC 13040) TaxID=521096 RepID=D5UMY5_TSUPD|nr:hypothetical protein [Tsukamurella paurometabola]ADG76877.1 hypothetical protein Tpau_0223 [Tsukamurella paurometabola DSM 20162]ADG78482.1 hypothetical protein Tpau_1869 [Tsukamurella paurometabola DSM 20162]ADG79609.1 hypothetical protein Tpau_3015 [Tsukamurella paurometabola DSM 20162]ADG79813.1 hypothetical protein Tpau_3228 [Tsukamurella paurometabola DSM 20162]SUP31846.1 Uncharacterised protein [Tsukamurella paurometabola]